MHSYSSVNHHTGERASDDRRGSITVGKDADLVVLSQDLFDPATEPLDILDTRTELVMVAGEVAIRRF